jgi:hypothetical protein
MHENIHERTFNQKIEFQSTNDMIEIKMNENDNENNSLTSSEKSNTKKDSFNNVHLQLTWKNINIYQKKTLYTKITSKLLKKDNSKNFKTKILDNGKLIVLFYF